MFLGEYKHSLDSKNRLRLPAKFKKGFNSEIVLTKGSDGCLFVLPKESFDSVFSKASTMPMFDSNVQRSLRLLFSSGAVIEEDNQGRFLLPQNLKSFACIDKDVVFVGVGSRVEIWSSEKWQAFSSDSNFDNIVEELSRYGI